MIALCIMAVGFSAFLGVALESMRDYEFFNSVNLVSQKNQEIVNTIRKDTLSSKQYFGLDVGADTYTQDYLAALELPAASMPMNSTRMPLIDEAGIFEVDMVGGTEKTGNGLFFVKTLSPFVAQDVPISDSEALDFRVSAYRFVYYYLTRQVNDTIGVSRDSLDLIRWSSTVVLDYRHVMDVANEVEDPDSGNKYYPRADIISQFVANYPGYADHFIWDSSETVDLSFYRCDAFGTISNAPEANMLIAQDPSSGLVSMISGGIRRGETYGTVRRGKRQSISMNDTETGFSGGAVVPELGLTDPTGDGFPHGFEIQLIGPNSARELMVRVALAKEGSRGIIERDFKAILTTRDL